MNPLVERGKTVIRSRLRVTAIFEDKMIDTQALIDTGNLLKTGLAVSLKFVQENRLPMIPVEYTVGTARKGAPLVVAGKVKGLTLDLGGGLLIPNCTAVVLEELSTNMNIGSALLVRHGAGLQFNEGKCSLSAGGITVPLIQQIEGDEWIGGDQSETSQEGGGPAQEPVRRRG